MFHALAAMSLYIISRFDIWTQAYEKEECNFAELFERIQ